jgi:hypothetical protein
MKSLKASSQNPVLYLRLRLCYKGFENTGSCCRLDPPCMVKKTKIIFNHESTKG